jgi:uncharacterized RDD family membrane protein YckC
MPDPQSFPDKSKFPERPKTQEQERSRIEWKTFTALPPPTTKLGFPQTETETSTQTEVETEVKLATWQKRVGSFALDFGLGMGISYLAQGLVALFGAGGEAVNLVGYGAFFATWLVNRGYFQSRPEGQSLGKWLLNIKTVDTETEQAPTLIRSVAREGVLSVLILTESLVVPLGADALFAFFDKQKRQSLHDRAGRTQVVEADTGFHLDEKAIEFLEGVMQGDATEDIKGVVSDLLQQAKRNDSVADVSRQLGRLGKDVGQNTRSLRNQTSKQVKSWVETIKKKLDNE